VSFNWASLTNPDAPTESAAPGAVATPTGNGFRARYDNATTHDENRRQWWGADALSARAANSFAVRRTLRNRSRYEVANNPFLFGIVQNNADDLIGTGPTLQVRTPSDKYNRLVERLWNEWCDEVAHTEKLKTSKLARTVDGEGFTLLKNVSDLEHPVKLFPVDTEADQVTSVMPRNLADYWLDGVTIHPVTGKPTRYHVLRNHPGDFMFDGLDPLAHVEVPARYVIHSFAKFRPGQVRGIPAFTPSLDLVTELRAYRRAVLGAAELAADFAAVLEQDREIGANAEDDDDTELAAFKRVPIDRKMLTTLPPGSRMHQFDARQPTTSYESFQEKCLGEAMRPLSYPLNLALGTSQKFNFSSSRLDFTNYRNALTVERADVNRVSLTPTFKEWFAEGVLCGAIPAYDGVNAPPHEWHWPGFEPLDPVTDANADHQRISNGTLTLREFWAKRGVDWQEALDQLTRERDELKRRDLQFGAPATKTISQQDDDQAGAKKPAEASGRGRIEAFDEGKVKRDADGKFSETGSSSQSSATLGSKARAAVASIKKIGAKAVGAAKEVAAQAKRIAYEATWATMKAGVHADDILDTAHDYSKIINDKAMNAEIASHLGIPLNAAVQGAITKVLAFGIVKTKQWIAKRREEKQGAKSSARPLALADDAPPLPLAERAKRTAEVLEKFLSALGVSQKNLPTAADLEAYLKKADKPKSESRAEVSIAH